MLPRPSAGILTGSGPGRKSGISLALNGNGGHSSSGAGGITLRERLSARSRVTNLGIVLLMGLACLSTLLNFRFLVVNYRLKHAPLPPPGFGLWETFHGLTPKMLKENIPKPVSGSEKLNHLVMVAGHAVWAGCDFKDRQSDEMWVLEEYQRGGMVKTFWKHIQKGIEIADSDPSALLVFSGGQTRSTSLQTEAESYFSLAISSGLPLPVLPGFNYSPGNGTGAGEVKHNNANNNNNNKAATANADEIMGRVGSGAQANAGVAVAKGLQGVRMTTENFAMDSFENLLFSVARFREYTGRYPLRITVVGYGMKKSRFEELHAKAIRWPVKGYHGGQRRFHYFGIDDEGDNTEQYEGEKIKGYRMFERDMYGCHGTLQDKRRARNPTRRFHSYYNGAPELADLLNWCPQDGLGLQGVYPLTLPWDLRITTDGWGRGAKQYREQHKSDILPDHRWLEVHPDRG